MYKNYIQKSFVSLLTVSSICFANSGEFSSITKTPIFGREHSFKDIMDIIKISKHTEYVCVYMTAQVHIHTIFINLYSTKILDSHVTEAMIITLKIRLQLDNHIFQYLIFTPLIR